MVLTAKRAAEICREWYVAFRNKGKGEEKCVLELLDAADTIEAMEAAQPKWISVEERLPELGEYFVRCIHNYTDNDEYEIYKVAFYMSKECRWIDVGNLLKVTHWMPIPSTEGLE